MPNRIIKDTICESKGLSKVSVFAADMYKRLLTYADDYGRFNADYQVLLARLYPREIGIVTEFDIEDAMTELIGVGKVAFYTSQPRDEVYGCFPKWQEHQRIRDSKKRLPDPGDTTINDYYLRRFVPIDLKARIIERDGFKCRECGKYIGAGMTDAKRLIKLGTGLFHIDHIVPVQQGGRATEENLRLLCAKCNLSRKRMFDFEEILAFAETCGNSPQLAATCGEPPPNPIQSNPIQSESNPNTNKRSRGSRFIPPTVEEVRAYCQERGNNVDPQHFVDYYEARGWVLSNGKKMIDFRAAVRTWERNDFGGGKRDSPKESGVGFGEILRQREYDDDYFASLEVDLTK